MKPTAAEIAIATAAQQLFANIEKAFAKVAEDTDNHFAEMTYASVTLAMLSTICVGLAQHRGKAAFDLYLNDVIKMMNDLVEQNTCELTKH